MKGEYRNSSLMYIDGEQGKEREIQINGEPEIIITTVTPIDQITDLDSLVFQLYAISL